MHGEIKREIFWNISVVSKIVFYVLVVVTLALFAYGMYRRVKLWLQGRKDEEQVNISGHVLDLLKQVFLHVKILRETFPGSLHALIFFGFFLLFIGTLFVMFEYDLGHMILRLKHYIVFKGSFYLVFSFVLELAGLALILGTLGMIVRRYVQRPDQLDNRADDLLLLLGLLLVGISGFFVEGLRIAASGAPPFEKYSFVGWGLTSLFSKGTPGVKLAHEIVWWLHAAIAFGLIVYIPFSKFKHVVNIPVNILLRSDKPRGAITPINIETAEHYGAGKIQELTWRQLLAADACIRCGRCQASCPAYTTDKPLSPKNVVQKVVDVMEAQSEETYIPQPIDPEEIWSCTTCAFCMEQCPAFVPHVDVFVEMRRYMIMQNLLAGTGAKALQKAMNSGNPWGLPQDEREEWIGDLEVRKASEGDFEYLYWIGCAGAYDPRNQKVTRAFVRLLQKLGVNFAILGNEEKCTGDFARRLGEEGLFQMLAMENIQTLQKYNVKKIITTCPHCYNTLKNEYPQFGGEFEVYHHTQFLAEYMKTKGLAPSVRIKEVFMYHDSCYLGRYNNIYNEPRQLLNMAVAGEIREFEKNYDKSFCCGGGGGHMFMEINIGQRINHARFEQALAKNPDRITTACPFCLIMFDDACKTKDMEDTLKIQDISEILLESLGD